MRIKSSCFDDNRLRRIKSRSGRELRRPRLQTRPEMIMNQVKVAAEELMGKDQIL